MAEGLNVLVKQQSYYSSVAFLHLKANSKGLDFQLLHRMMKRGPKVFRLVLGQNAQVEIEVIGMNLITLLLISFSSFFFLSLCNGKL